jgi:predicted GNAT family acetyltransferase
VPVTDNTLERRFELDVEGDVAYLAYEVVGDRLVFRHTFVPRASRNRGVGALLVEAALEAASSRGLSVVPECSFARGYLEQRPEVAARVKLDAPGTT